MPDQKDGFVYPLSSLGGIKRDGTSLDGNYYSDGLWCRFRNGRPKKIGGWRDITNVDSQIGGTGAALNSPIRNLFPFAASPLYIVYNFHGQGITGVLIDNNGVGSGRFDRTPGAPFIAQDAYSWQIDALFDVTGTPNTMMIAHPAQNLADIASDVATDVYFGVASNQGAVLTQVGQQVSGGLCVLQPCVFLYGSNGLIKNSDANKCTTYTGGISNTANVAGTKIVKGLPLRGGANSPAGLFWGIDCLIRVTFVGGTTLWKYDMLSEETSILSSNAVIEYDGVFFWPGVDRFLMYNGVIQEVPNALNQDFFFDNLNFAQRQKVWVTKLPRWGEIWWFFPKGSSTECNWAIVYNVRENTWYDTPITRTAGYPPRELTFPIWADASPNTALGYNAFRIYRHEFGVDSIIGAQQTAIPSYFESSDQGFATGGVSPQGTENQNVQTRISRIEPDFKQSGTMTVQVRGTSFAQDAQSQDSAELPFTPTGPFPAPSGGVPTKQSVIDLREQRRLLRLKFKSNDLGGNYHAGKILLHIEPGDQRG